MLSDRNVYMEIKGDFMKRNLHKQGIYEKYIKRYLDVWISLTFIFMFFWLYIGIAILVKIKLGGPVLFKQKRPGLNGKIFDMVKFRTMTDERDEKGNLLPDEERLTKFGKWLRATSLDELPEMFLVLKGDMSLIGPRPLLVSYLPLYNKHQQRRHEVKPGLTGLAQIKGRNAISWNKKFDYDVYYVEHISFFMDIFILIQTIHVVLKREGISSDTSVTMEAFTGND